MCGIAGIVTPESRKFERPLDKMVSRLAHRGSDGGGVYFWKNCGLGHRRLSIVDLSTGDQPMFSSNKQIGIVFNGEIYGYKEIKNKLNGFNFQTTSDTELILALYEKYGCG
jgi:asparagine synthase (glutamine-hydrolysing)